MVEAIYGFAAICIAIAGLYAWWSHPFRHNKGMIKCWHCGKEVYWRELELQPENTCRECFYKRYTGTGHQYKEDNSNEEG